MSHLRALARRSAFADGTPWVVRLALLAAGLCVLALGIGHMPAVATNHGELVAGVILSVAVALQILFAAFFFPAGARRLR
jgi:hypothetical protein